MLKRLINTSTNDTRRDTENGQKDTRRHIISILTMKLCKKLMVNEQLNETFVSKRLKL